MDKAGDLLNQFLLALCVWREARGETEHGQLLVATVIRNRAMDDHRRWPSSIPGVITQHLQFSSFNSGDPNALQFPATTDPSWPGCVDAALQVIANWGTPITTANHYHVRGLDPGWADPSKIITVEGHHVFYCL